MSTATIITTAEGKIVEFNDAVSKFIVAHPRVAAGLALALGALLGHML